MMRFSVDNTARPQGRWFSIASAVISVLIIISLVLTCFGIISDINNVNEKYVETTGKVVGIPVGTTGAVTTAITFEANGVEYTVNYYDETINIGDDIILKYDPENPTTFSVGVTSFSYIFVVFVAVIVIILLVNFIRSVKMIKSFVKTEKSSYNGNNGGYVPGSSTVNTDEEKEFGDDLRKLYCYAEKYEIHLEDENRAVLYEAVCDKHAIVGNSDYTFKNNEKGMWTKRKIGSLLSQNEIDCFPQGTFSVDGYDVWTVIKKNGAELSYEPLGNDGNMKITVIRDGAPFATIYTAGEDPRHFRGNGVPKVGYYSIDTNAKELDLLFMIVFALFYTTPKINFGRFINR